MFDRKSDYAMNKKESDAIVCKSVTDIHTRLTREDFASDQEFQEWKVWSDQDYRDTEAAGRSFYDNSLPLDERLVTAGLSMEELLLETISQAEHNAARAELVQKIRHSLTEKQFRRLSLYYLHGMTEAEIGKWRAWGSGELQPHWPLIEKLSKKFSKFFLITGAKKPHFFVISEGHTFLDAFIVF